MEKIFNNDKLFYAAPWVLFLAYIVSYGLQIVLGWGYGYSYLPLVVFNFVIVLLIVGSYKKHEKNMMKGLVGGLITLIAYRALMQFIDLFKYDNVHLFEYLISLIITVLTLVLFINHFRLTSDHKSSPSTMKKSQIICVLIIVIEAIWYVFDIITYGTDVYVQYTIICVAEILAVICRLYVIIAVETRLDLFKIEREHKQELNEEELSEVDGGFGAKAVYYAKCKTCDWKSQAYNTMVDAHNVKQCGNSACGSSDIVIEVEPRYTRKK